MQDQFGNPDVAHARREALKQAVIWANALAGQLRKSPEEITAAAEVFRDFLDPPPAE